MITPQRSAVPYSIVRVILSPTTEPMVAARKPKSITAIAHLVAVKNSISADDSVKKTSAFLIGLEPLFVIGHSLETQDIH